MRRYLGRLALALSLSVSGCISKPEGIEDNASTVSHAIQQPKLEQILTSLETSNADIAQIPQTTKISIDISDTFIPELLKSSKYASEYLSTQGIFADPQERERFGLFSTFEYRTQRLRHFHNAVLRSKNDTPLGFDEKRTLTKHYTTTKTLEQITALETLEKKTPREEKSLVALQEKVENVKALQQYLFWEGFYEGPMDGNYEKTVNAVKEFQKYHFLSADGKTGRKTKEILFAPLSEKERQAHADLLRVFEERVFHATHVIHQQQLMKLTNEAAKQLKIDTIEGALEFFENNQRSNAIIELDIPEIYKNKSLNLKVEITKSENDRKNSKLQLYALHGEKETLLYETRVVVGGKNDVRGHLRDFDTPVGKYYMKRIVVFPYWHPPSWAEEKFGKDEPSTQPGPLNAYGMFMAEYFKNNKAPKNPYEGWLSGDAKIRIHLTASPQSVESGYGASHGCTRLHPSEGSRFFYFINHFTLHHEMRGFSLRGELVPFQKGHYIPVLIKE